MYEKAVDYVMPTLLRYLDGAPNLGHSQMGLGQLQCLFKALMGLKKVLKRIDLYITNRSGVLS